jgi:hypothetical protein
LGGVPAGPAGVVFTPGFGTGGCPVGLSRMLGLSPPCGVLATAPAGGGGAPLAPGTGSTLALGSSLAFGSSLIFPCPCGVAVGTTFVGTTGAVVPGLIAGVFARLGGTGSLPCWISDARCLTEGGRAAVAAVAACGDTAGAAVPGVGTTGGAGGGWLITVLMTVVLWMLL